MNKKLVKYPFLTREVEIYELDNGHKIVLAHKEGGLVNISSWVKTGSINEDSKNNGISHFLEHLMFKGTHKHKAGDFDRILEAKGAIVNAATWKDYTFYYVTLPKGNNNENFYTAIELHADMMLDPVVPDYEMGAPFNTNDKNITDKKERHVVIEEIRMRQDQPWTKVYNACNHGIYTNHPYKMDVIGTPEVISQVSQQDIMDYYRSFYTPQNITTIVVGDFNHEEILEKLIKEFSNWGERETKQIKRTIDTPVQSTVYTEQQAEITSAFMMFGYLCANATNLKETIIMEMLAIILGDGTSSRLNQNLIEKVEEPIFNMVNAEHYQFKEGNNFFIQANFKPDKKDEAIKAIENEIDKILNNNVTEEELQKAKKKIKSQFAFNAETVSEIGETIGYYMTVCDSLEQVEEYLDVLSNIKAEDLRQCANKYLTLNHASISLLMPLH